MAANIPAVPARGKLAPLAAADGFTRPTCLYPPSWSSYSREGGFRGRSRRRPTRRIIARAIFSRSRGYRARSPRWCSRYFSCRCSAWGWDRRRCTPSVYRTSTITWPAERAPCILVSFLSSARRSLPLSLCFVCSPLFLSSRKIPIHLVVVINISVLLLTNLNLIRLNVYGFLLTHSNLSFQRSWLLNVN